MAVAVTVTYVVILVVLLYADFHSSLHDDCCENVPVQYGH